MNVTLIQGSITVIIRIDSSVIYDLARDIAVDNGITGIENYRDYSIEI